MTASREQTRRDAEAKIATGHHTACNSRRGGECDCYMLRADYRIAVDYLSSLAELEQAERKLETQPYETERELAVRLEQAERERDAERVIVETADLACDLAKHRANEAEARLAKVPALVEAAKKVADMPTAIVDSGAHERLRDALADFEQEQHA